MPGDNDEPAVGGSPGTVALIERSIVLLLVLGLLVGVLAVLRPFTTAILFGSAMAIAAWPLRQAMVRRGFKRGIAAALLLLLVLVVVVVPLLILAPELTEQLGHGMQRVEAYFAGAPPLPSWLAGLPAVGSRIALGWDTVVRAQGDVHAVVAPYEASLRGVLLTVAQALADSTLQLILSLIVATALWINGDALSAVLRDIFRRLGGATAEQTLDAATGAIRGVAYGVVGTAVIQAALLGLGLALAGVPGAMMLGFIALLLAISQVGAVLLVVIWGGAAWWLFAQGDQAWCIAMVAWGLFVNIIDNFIRPWLIGMGVRMPLSLTILGVFGGFVAFGFLGLFIGPTLIAVAFTLLQAWRAVAPARRSSQYFRHPAPPGSP